MFTKIQFRPLMGAVILTIGAVTIVDWVYCAFLTLGAQGFRGISWSMLTEKPWNVFAQASREVRIGFFNFNVFEITVTRT